MRLKFNTISDNRLADVTRPHSVVFVQHTLIKISKISQKKYTVFMAWVVGFLDESVKAGLNALPADIRANFQCISELIQTYALERVRRPYVRHWKGHSGKCT